MEKAAICDETDPIRAETVIGLEPRERVVVSALPPHALALYFFRERIEMVRYADAGGIEAGAPCTDLHSAIVSRSRPSLLPVGQGYRG